MAKKKSYVKTIQLDKNLNEAIDKRLKQLDTDFSKYARAIIISEILMKSADKDFQKLVLNP